MIYKVDLHAHTTASDGTHTPAQLVVRAAARGLSVLGITDHDTIDGLTEAMEVGRQMGVEIVPGIEFSLKHEPEKGFIGTHLLGYFINPNSPALNEMVQKVQKGRLEQKIKQIEKLQLFGFDIPVDEVLKRASGVPGRPHIAAVLMERNPGKFKNFQQVFDEYLGAHARAHVKRDFTLSLEQAVEVIKEAGGVAVFAHPGIYDTVTDPLTAVRNAYKEGLEGVEVFYPYSTGQRGSPNRVKWIAQMETLADELNLLKTGGTDFHGRNGEMVDLGDMGLNATQYNDFKQKCQQLRTTQAQQ